MQNQSTATATAPLPDAAAVHQYWIVGSIVYVVNPLQETILKPGQHPAQPIVQMSPFRMGVVFDHPITIQEVEGIAANAATHAAKNGMKNAQALIDNVIKLS